MRLTTLAAGLLSAVAASASVEKYGSSVPIDISRFLNNKATSRGGPTDGVGMRNGSTMPSEYLPTGEWMHDGVRFNMPNWDGEFDNIRVDSQALAIGNEPTELRSLHILGVGEDPGGG